MTKVSFKSHADTKNRNVVSNLMLILKIETVSNLMLILKIET